MGVERLTKKEIAERHLLRAARLLAVDPVCSLHLAGAADEILGKLAEREGIESTLSEFVSVDSSVHELRQQADPTVAAFDPKKARDEHNDTRNQVKHHGGVDYVEKDFHGDAWLMLMRAAGNYVRLYDELPDDPELRAFWEAPYEP